MNKTRLSTCELSYQIFGEGNVNLVIEMALGATAGEWWHIASQFAKQYTVLLYERNRSTSTERTPQNIASELYGLLEQLHCAEKLILLAHSQGGLYAQQFTRLYPQMVKGIVLIDPLSANDNHYKEILTQKEQKQSGFDKTGNLAVLKCLAALHLGFVIKAIMKKAPPFCYYKNFSKEVTEYILTALTVPTLYISASEEYRLSHVEQIVFPLKGKTDFPDIPLVLITHTSEFAIKEIVASARTSTEFAKKVEALWQSLMKEYLSFSSINKFVQAKKSGHFVHLTEPELINESLLWIEKNTAK